MPTVLSDLFLPNILISAGIRGKNIRRNDRVAKENGFTDINVGWTQALRQYEFGTVPMRIEQWQAIEALHEITAGGAYGFLMEDPKDNAVTAVNGAVSYEPAIFFIDSFTGVTHYQLQRRYIDIPSGRYKDRAITRPRAAGFTLYRSGALVNPSTYTLDPETGWISMDTMSEEDAATLTWSGRFYTPVHFLEDFIDWDLIAPGAHEQRFLAGPSVVLQEIRE